MTDQNKWNGENPWLGLGAYNEGQRLYGRDKETTALTDIIVNHTASVVYGKSGIGKSSLLRSGVFPQLRQRRFVPIYIRLAHNIDVTYSLQIENAIKENVIANDILPSDIPDLGLWDFLHRHRFTDAEGETVTPVVVLDQFEEIFTLTTVEHKFDVQDLFSQLADVLNDVKPDKVIEAEVAYVQRTAKTEISAAGFTLQSLSKSALCYEKSPSFRIVFSLRDDSLYLLERNSAKIPALKVNRYNLCALDEESALEVITKPCPNLFSEAEAHRILDGLAYYEYDEYRIVDPAILSLFLYSYYKEQGRLAYTDIFERYYQDCIKDIKEDSISYIEDHLLTERGNRNQIPTDELLASGISPSELNSLLQRKILKTEKRKGQDYSEFSHDRLCEQALKHREERNIREQTRKMRKRMFLVSFIVLLLIGISSLFFWQNNERLRANITANLAADKALRADNEKRQAKWEKDSISKLNRSLEEWRSIIEAQNYRLLIDSIVKEQHLSRILKDSILLRQGYDSIKISNDSINAKNKSIEEKSNMIKQMQGMTIYNSCVGMRNALDEGNMKDLKLANNVFKSCNTLFWSALRSINEDNLSFNGHFIFSPIFVDSLIVQGKKVYQFAEHYNKIQFLQDAIREAEETVNYRTCMVGASSSVKYVFKSRGRQELAFVTEPQGVISVRIYDKNHNTYYNYDRGVPYRFVTLELSNECWSTLEVEVINKTNADLSFVIISNYFTVY